MIDQVTASRVQCEHLDDEVGQCPTIMLTLADSVTALGLAADRGWDVDGAQDLCPRHRAAATG